MIVYKHHKKNFLKRHINKQITIILSAVILTAGMPFALYAIRQYTKPQIHAEEFAQATVLGPSITPTDTSTQTNNPAAGQTTQASLNLFLDGIGAISPGSVKNIGGNLAPLHPDRFVSLTLFDASNQLLGTQSGTITYSSPSATFAGTIDLGTPTSSISAIAIKTNGYLEKDITLSPAIVAGQSAIIPQTSLTAGDINNDNHLDILDYNILINCYSDLQPAKACNDIAKNLADINDDGSVNGEDYNLFIKELSLLNSSQKSQ